MSITSIREGQMSSTQRDGGVYNARLSAFQENYVRPQFEIDTDAITQEMMKSENFAKAALGSKVTPSNANMYESHYQLAKDKFDLLYSDETLNHFSKDEEGMRKWSDLVDQLNQEISMYEQIYEDSYGDPNKVDGNGSTYSDYIKRANAYGGDESEWFLNQGLSTLNPNSANEIMKNIDSKQHSNLKLDLESGTFDYDVTGGLDRNFLEPTDPNMAANLFSYQTEQALFKTEADFVGGIAPTFDNDGEEMARKSLANLRQNPQYVNAAVNSYQISMDDDNPDKQKKVTDLVAEYETAGSLNAVFKSFEDNIIAAAKKRSAKAKAKLNKDKTPPGGRDAVDNNINAEVVGLSKNDVDTMPEGYTEGDFLKFKFDEKYLDPQRGKVSSIIYDKKKGQYFGWIRGSYEFLDSNDVPDVIEEMVNSRLSTTTEIPELTPDENGVGSNY